MAVSDKYRSIQPTEARPLRRAATYGAAVLLAFTLQSAVAHRAPGSLTTVEWNDRSQRTEIVHRLHSHDAELGVGTVVGDAALSTLTLDGRAQIALYVEERFAIEQDGKRVALDLLGAELIADYLLIYQEHDKKLTGEIRVRDDILRDVFPAQINQVNIADGATVRSLAFSGDDGWRDFRFENPAK